MVRGRWPSSTRGDYQPITNVVSRLDLRQSPMSLLQLLYSLAFLKPLPCMWELCSSFNTLCAYFTHNSWSCMFNHRLCQDTNSDSAIHITRHHVATRAMGGPNWQSQQQRSSRGHSSGKRNFIWGRTEFSSGKPAHLPIPRACLCAICINIDSGIEW
jgi:hypothetical protein